MKKFALFFIVMATCSYAVLAQNRLSSVIWRDSLPVVDLQYIQTHPLRNTIKTRSSSQIMLNTPPICDQGNLNSCVGWALCYAGASIRLYDSIPDWSIAKCSPSYLFNQHKGSSAIINTSDCDSVSSNILYLGLKLTQEGTCSFAQMPYTTNCNLLPTTADSIDALNKRFSVNQIPASSLNDTSFYKIALRKGWPIVVGMPMYNVFDTIWNDPSAYGLWDRVDTTDYDHNAAGHASCIVGYDDTKEAFKVMNSWGTSGGDNGYYWVKYNLIQKGIYREALFVIQRDSAQIEGPGILTDTTAWYHLRNVPAGATITWSITNISPLSSKTFVRASAQGRDSVRIAYRDLSINPGGPKAGDTPAEPLITRYQYADLTVTVSSGSNSYSTTKRIGKQITIAPHPFFLRSNTANDNMIVNTNDEYLPNAGNYTIELWHSMYGLMRTQEIQNTNESVETVGLPQGVYIILCKDQNGAIIDQKKIMVNN